MSMSQVEGPGVSFAETLDQVESKLERDLTAVEMDMVRQMRDAGKTVREMAEVIGKEVPKPDPRTRRFEGVGTSTLVEITDVPIVDDTEEKEESDG